MSCKSFSIILSICFLMGCSDFLKGHKKEDKVLKFKGNSLVCLKEISKNLETLFSEDSDPIKFEDTLSCLEVSLSYFNKKTIGNASDGYLVQDLKTFFGNYLGNDDLISELLGQQLMKVKTALFGGSEQSISKIQIQQLIELIASIRDEVRILRPVWDVIVLKDSIYTGESVVDETHRVLAESLNRIISKTNLTSSDYSFSDLKILLVEIENFKNKKSLKIPLVSSNNNISQWLPIIESVKKHLFGQVTELNSPAKWQNAVAMVLEIHHVYSLYKYNFKSHSFYSRKAFGALDRMLEVGISLLEQSWPLEHEGIPFSETKQLLKALSDREILPKAYSPEIVFKGYKALVTKWLNRDRSGRVLNLNTFSRDHLSLLKGEFSGFRVVQDFIDLMPDRYSYADLIQKLEKVTDVQVRVFSEISDDYLNSIWRDWKTHLMQTRPLHYLESGGLVLDQTPEKSKEWTWSGLTRLNMMRFFTRVFMMSFGTQGKLDLSLEYLNENSVIDFYSTFWDFGIMLKAFDERSGNSGKRTFFEGDHFLYSSNGDGKLDLQESFELVNIIFSAGLNGVSQIQKELSNSHCALKEVDTFENNWLDENCFKMELHRNFSRYFQNLPGFTKWVVGLNESDWESFYNDLIGFSRNTKQTQGKIETADIRTLVVILHYVESVYLKLDTNLDNQLSIPEIRVGSQRFAQFFKSLWGLKPVLPFFKKEQDNVIDFGISLGFACTVIEGKLPTLGSCIDTFGSEIFKKKPRADRGEILRTLNAFKSAIK
jgi:hypothetical protein